MTTNQSPWMMKTDILELLNNKQVWEMSDMELMKVKMELLRMNGKVHNEQQLRFMAEESERSDYFQDTPMADAFGG